MYEKNTISFIIRYQNSLEDLKQKERRLQLEYEVSETVQELQRLFED